MNQLIGQCSNCGGSVTVPKHWSGTVPAVPTCNQCGYIVRGAPVIKTEPLKANPMFIVRMPRER